MSAHLSIQKPKRARPPRARALAREYQGVTYRPQFALGLICRDEADQRRLYPRLLRLAGAREVKVLVI
jgi:hypothetical protein